MAVLYDGIGQEYRERNHTAGKQGDKDKVGTGFRDEPDGNRNLEH